MTSRPKNLIAAEAGGIPFQIKNHQRAPRDAVAMDIDNAGAKRSRSPKEDEAHDNQGNKKHIRDERVSVTLPPAEVIINPLNDARPTTAKNAGKKKQRNIEMRDKRTGRTGKRRGRRHRGIERANADKELSPREQNSGKSRR